jgi:HK97 family phage portal protein
MSNWFKNIFSRSSPTIPITSNEVWSLFPRNTSSAGVRVDHHSCMGIPALWKGINLISNKVAGAACRIYTRGPNNSRIRDENHPAYKLLRGFSNPIQSHFELFRCLVSNSIVAGNGYLAIERDGDATPIALWLLDPEQTTPYVTYDGYKPAIYYETVVNGQKFTLQADDCIHVKGPTSPCSLVGYRLTEIMRENLGLNIAVQKMGAIAFKNNMAVTNVIQLPSLFQNKEQLETFRDGLTEKHVGIDQGFKVMLLQNGATFQHVSLNMEESQFIESRNLTLVDCANILGLTASKLNGQVATSYSSLEVENLALLGDCYSPWMINIQLQLSKLLREDEKETKYVEYDLNDLITLDQTTRTSNAISMYNNNLMSWEETRAEWNLPTVKDEEQTWCRPANIIVEGEEPLPAPGVTGQNTVNSEVEASPQQLPTDTEADDTTSRSLNKLLFASVDRLITRMKKDTNLDLDKHRDVIKRSLPGFSTLWLDELAEELKSILPEQRPKVINNLSTLEIVRKIQGSS